MLTEVQRLGQHDGRERRRRQQRAYRSIGTIGRTVLDVKANLPTMACFAGYSGNCYRGQSTKTPSRQAARDFRRAISSCQRSIIAGKLLPAVCIARLPASALTFTLFSSNSAGDASVYCRHPPNGELVPGTTPAKAMATLVGPAQFRTTTILPSCSSRFAAR